MTAPVSPRPRGPLPLDGTLVVSVEQAVAAPLATRHLADLGARVIKVERPRSGDFARDYDTVVGGLSSHFVWLNRSKESVTADLKDPDQLARVKELIAGADVFVLPGTSGANQRHDYDGRPNRLSWWRDLATIAGPELGARRPDTPSSTGPDEG